MEQSHELFSKIKGRGGASLVPRCREGGGEKGAPGVYCMRMRVNFQKFLENRNTSGQLRYTDFCEVVEFYCVKDAYHSHALCER